MPRRSLRKALLGIIGLAALLFLWETASNNYEIWPKLSEAGEAIGGNSVALWKASAATAARVILGASLGYLLGLIAAIVAVRSMTIRWLSYLPIELIRPIPAVALTPFFIALFGITDTAQIALIALGVFMISYVSYLDGLARVSPIIIRGAETMGIRGFKLITKVLLPSCWGSQLGTLRVALAFSLGLSVAAEFLGSREGLGYVIRNAKTILALDVIAACCVCLAVIGLIFDFLASLAHRYTAGWAYPRSRNEK